MASREHLRIERFGGAGGLERALWIAAFALVLGVAVLYVLDGVAEQIAGVLFATLAIGLACAYALRAMLDAAPSRAVATTSVVLVGASFGAALVPAVLTLAPGSPLAHGALSAAGDALPLPAATRGPLRLLIRGRLPGSAPGNAEIALDVGGEHVRGALRRTHARARVGRRGSTTVVREHNSEYLDVEAARGADRVQLASIAGALGGPLQIDVFRNRTPLPAEIAVGAALLLLAALVVARFGARPAGLTALASALFFGDMVQRVATPDAAVGPEFGALLASAFAGLLLSALLLACVQKAIDLGGARQRRPPAAS